MRIGWLTGSWFWRSVLARPPSRAAPDSAGVAAVAVGVWRCQGATQVDRGDVEIGSVRIVLFGMPYVDVNGVHMYYEERGEGPPLVLLHGGLLTIELSFGSAIPLLAEHHRVIAVELQGHGRTADIDRPMAFEHLAADVVGCWTTSASRRQTCSGSAWVG